MAIPSGIEVYLHTARIVKPLHVTATCGPPGCADLAGRRRGPRRELLPGDLQLDHFCLGVGREPLPVVRQPDGQRRGAVDAF